MAAGTKRKPTLAAQHERAGTQGRRVPRWLAPMKPTLTDKRFTDAAWTFERKLDGIRVLAFKDGQDVRLLSRNQLPQNAAYPAVVEAVANLPVDDVVLDGEATGAWGRQGRADYYVFDVLWLNGRDLRPLPLVERRQQLDTLPLDVPLGRVRRVAGSEPWTAACERGWEGVIAKRLDAPYEGGRSTAWLKMKCSMGQELVVGGFTAPQGRRVGLGALLVGYYDGDDFVFAGKVGTGLDDALLRRLREQFESLRQDQAPFTRGAGLPRAQVTWVTPQVVVQVAFTEWTPHGKLRHPRLLGVRVDKPAAEVVREQG